MDFETLDVAAAAEEGAVLHLKHPTTGALLFDTDADGDTAAVTITLAGGDSDRVKAVQRAQVNRRLQRRARDPMTAEEVESEAIDVYAAATLSWTNIALGGEALACTPANAKKLYRRMPWVREQVDQFIYERGNFLKP
jgi:hypothetical protein